MGWLGWVAGRTGSQPLQPQRVVGSIRYAQCDVEALQIDHFARRTGLASKEGEKLPSV